ncbi:hypothetical protein FTUN_1826 [Frigoriglobus tundricola]|uniref:Uncharacterized protein n=1 Tax=Frigoriglobus tundricola TaxID=2774151 RepID=A0A6M5YLV5_9BACT|nr:hypothetical protein [Frigoriglobus tundricola]QJW94306.1 hypothetical protein FTUN_1826 [Frigoriglobus tundricola]
MRAGQPGVGRRPEFDLVLGRASGGGVVVRRASPGATGAGAGRAATSPVLLPPVAGVWYWHPIRNRPTHSSEPWGSGATRIRSPFTTTPRPDRSTTHSPDGVETMPQWYGEMSSAVRWILQSAARPTSVSSRFTCHRSLARRPFRNSSATTGRVLSPASAASGL